jgi:hypothetical protein
MEEEEASRSGGLSPDQLEVLADLTRFISCDAELPPVATGTENYFKLRFEAAEVRYGRMRALLCESLEQQARLRGECVALEIAGLMKTLRVRCAGGDAALWTTLNELKAVRAEVSKLKEMNRCLREHRVPVVELPPCVLIAASQAETELRIARRRISALELELVRMSDQHFMVEELVREHQDVIDNLMGQVTPCNELAVPPRDHPVNTCASAACRTYARRLRNGLRQEVAAAYVRDRCVRMYGYFQHAVRPVEVLRSETDAEIHMLRLRLSRLECATLMSADEATEVDDRLAGKVSDIKRLTASAETLRVEVVALRASKRELVRELLGLQDEIRDARHATDELKEVRALCHAEKECLRLERERLERVCKQMESFRDGRMLVEFERMLAEFQALERDLEAARRAV